MSLEKVTTSYLKDPLFDDDILEAIEQANENSSNLLELINRIRSRVIPALEMLRIYLSCFNWLAEQDKDEDIESESFKEVKHNERIAFEIRRKFSSLSPLEAVKQDPLDVAKYIAMLKSKLAAQHILHHKEQLLATDLENWSKSPSLPEDTSEDANSVQTVSETMNVECCPTSDCSMRNIGPPATLDNSDSLSNLFFLNREAKTNENPELTERYKKQAVIHLKFEECPTCVQYRQIIMDLKRDKSWCTNNLERSVTVQRYHSLSMAENIKDILTIVTNVSNGQASQRRLLKEEFKKTSDLLLVNSLKSKIFQETSNVQSANVDSSATETSIPDEQQDVSSTSADKQQLSQQLEALQAENAQQSEQIKNLEEELRRVKLKYNTAETNLKYMWNSLENIRINVSMDDNVQNGNTLLKMPLICSKCKTEITDELDLRTCEGCYLVFCSVCIPESGQASASNLRPINLCHDCSYLNPFPSPLPHFEK